MIRVPTQQPGNIPNLQEENLIVIPTAHGRCKITKTITNKLEEKNNDGIKLNGISSKYPSKRFFIAAINVARESVNNSLNLNTYSVCFDKLDFP